MCGGDQRISSMLAFNEKNTIQIGKLEKLEWTVKI